VPERSVLSQGTFPLCLEVALIARVPRYADVVHERSVLSQVVFLLCLEVALIARVPRYADVVSVGEVSFQVTYPLCRVVAVIALKLVIRTLHCSSFLICGGVVAFDTLHLKNFTFNPQNLIQASGQKKDALRRLFGPRNLIQKKLGRDGKSLRMVRGEFTQPLRRLLGSGNNY
jgi:hypothetical protein